MPDSLLPDLARAYGVATEYWDQAGKHVAVSDETVAKVLEAAGADLSKGAAAELARLRTEHWQRTLPPVVVMKSGDAPWVWVHVPHGEGIRAWVVLEGGGERHDVGQADRWVEPERIDGQVIGEATIVIPADLPLGWHELCVEVSGRTHRSPLVVTPRSLLNADTFANGRMWGFMAQLYSVRSRRSWGLGDLADLGDLAAWSAHDLGADFLLVNPLHAASPVAPMAPSPYLPVTRRFANPIYIRVEAIPEFAYLDDAARVRIEVVAERIRRLNASNALLDRDAVWAAKLPALAAVFEVELSPGRRAAFDSFCEQEGQGLYDFATWSALTEHFAGKDFPPEYQSPTAPAVTEFRKLHAQRIRFHSWLQWILDEQLATAQRAAQSAGMACGIMHDLAVGVHPGGSDAWALQDVLATSVSVGAPPDMYNQMGQDWSQPPWRPRALEAAGYAPYRDMLRTVLRHAGGIRIDHVLGLFRLWWVPKGNSAAEGTFVRYDHEALVGILALEAHRAGALVVGEDLGTVEPWVQQYLQERGVLGTSILWFERNPDGSLRKPEQWRENCLGSVTVHDLPPTAGYLRGEHVRIRHELGLLAVPVEQEQAAHEQEMQLWKDLLTEQGLLRPNSDEQAFVETLHRFLATTPTKMLGVALPDAVGDARAQNQPGTDQEYPNWRVPLCDANLRSVLLEDLPTNARLKSLIAALGMSGRRG